MAGADRWQETDGGSDGGQSMAASRMGCTLGWINNSASDKERMSISISISITISITISMLWCTVLDISC